MPAVVVPRPAKLSTLRDLWPISRVEQGNGSWLQEEPSGLHKTSQVLKTMQTFAGADETPATLGIPTVDLCRVLGPRLTRGSSNHAEARMVLSAQSGSGGNRREGVCKLGTTLESQWT